MITETLPATENILSQLTIEKAKAITEKLEKIGMIINDIEIDLHDTLNIKYTLLVPDEKHPTLWCQFYKLEKMFRDYIKED